jgi:hypothetical protein
MSAEREKGAPVHDRALLLHGRKRNQVLTLEEVEQYGRDSFGDADYVCLYGMRPREWYERGIRILGRTAVECTRDVLAEAIGRELAALVSRLSPVPFVMAIDPFAGSCNTLHWIVRQLPPSEGLAFELDPQVFDLTRRNLALLHRPIELLHGDYATLLGGCERPDGRGLLFFIAPPWGTALDEQKGLDLRRTVPPVTEIIAGLSRRFDGHPMLFAVQVHEKVDAGSLQEVRALLDWTDLHVYALDTPGRNHGIVLGTRTWSRVSS